MPSRADQDPHPKTSIADELSSAVMHRGPHEAAALLDPHPDSTVVDVLVRINPSLAQEILALFRPERRRTLFAAAPPDVGRQWTRNQGYPEDTIGRLMDPPIAVFSPRTTIAEAVEQLRELVKRAFITYGFVTEPSGRLVGVIVMRDLLLGRREQRLEEIMIRDPFYLSPEASLTEAMRLVLNKHFPVYPVADKDGRLLGLVRGQTLFEAQAIEISAQAGSMVGVGKEERLATPLTRSLRMRHPWLQLNLLTAFLAAGVVGYFQGTINKLVILAVFLPVLAGQSTNTGCQALAVALRGLTLGELESGRERTLLLKEGVLGLINGGLVGISAGLGMFVMARFQGLPDAAMLGVIVFLAMMGSCVVTGIFGALIPLLLRRFGADPATASSIFLTTISDIASMGLFLGLAAWLVV